jgi:hypothetical protein
MASFTVDARLYLEDAFFEDILDLIVDTAMIIASTACVGMEAVANYNDVTTIGTKLHPPLHANASPPP